MQCIFPKPRTFFVLITFLDDTKRLFKIPITQKGSNTLLNITNSLPIYNKEYFGLRYLDKFEKPHWINLEKSLYQQLKKSQIDRTSGLSDEPCFNMEFEVRYYPRDPTSIDDENFRYQIFLQIRKDLSTMKLAIKDETILSVLCGLILQSDFGDYSGNRFAPHYIRQTINPHLLTPFVEDKIKNEHIKLRGIEPIEAEYRFLEKIRWLENYGTIIFPVKDCKNKYCYFGLNPQGFSLRFHKEPNLNYDIFWPRVSAIKRKGRQIIIKEKTDISKKHYFETGEKSLCVVLYKLSLDHFAFFKSKKDEKPLVNEPPKRSFGRSSSKEFGYSSDTSDNNQYSDDTFSSYPDSINTTQSSKTTKFYKKTNVPPRNCMSDVEESALSKKNRRVIVSRSQTETEDEIWKPSDYQPIKTNTFDFSSNQTTKIPLIAHSKSYDRIPPDYIYENRLSKPFEPSNLQNRPKRMRKKVPSQSYIERRMQQDKNGEIIKNISDKQIADEKKIRPLSNDTRQTRSKQVESVDRKEKMPRQLPSTHEIIPKSSDSVNKTETLHRDYRINQSASVDSISNLKKVEDRLSPTKRLLPNLSMVVSSNATLQPPIPRHRIQPNVPFNPENYKKPPPIYADIWYQPAHIHRIPQNYNFVERKGPNFNTANNRNIEKPLPNKNQSRYPPNYQSKFRPESGI